MLMGTIWVLKFDPSSPLGYERKHAMLLGMGLHDATIDAFETMLSKMSESSDPEIHSKGNHIILILFH